MASYIITEVPGGEKFLCGGTRKGVKLSRPVEAGTLFDPTKTKCPFHRPDEQALAEYFDGEIRVLANPMTPHRDHVLIIPRECTTEAEVRELGGRNILERCFYALAGVVSRRPEHLSFMTHVLRGQNVPHLHWHLYAHHPEEQPDTAREALWMVRERNPDLVIFECGNFQVVARGTKVGQLMLIPLVSPVVSWVEIAGLLHDIVILADDAFKSNQGEPPRYTVAGRVSERNFKYLVYTPELQPLGGPDDLADFNGTARARAWLPEETALHLRKHIAPF